MIDLSADCAVLSLPLLVSVHTLDSMLWKCSTFCGCCWEWGSWHLARGLPGGGCSLNIWQKVNEMFSYASMTVKFAHYVLNWWCLMWCGRTGEWEGSGPVLLKSPRTDKLDLFSNCSAHAIPSKVSYVKVPYLWCEFLLYGATITDEIVPIFPLYQSKKWGL